MSESLIINGDANGTNVLPPLDAWYGRELEPLYKRVERASGLFMGCPVWGDAYVERFLRYTLASILSASNLDALRNRCRIALYTSQEDFPRLVRGTADLPRGIDMQIDIIPPEVIALTKLSDINAYWILGTVNGIHLQMCKRLGMAYHMLAPDHVFPVDYFQNLFRLAEKFAAIAQGNISAKAAEAGAELDTLRSEDGTLAIPDRTLGDIGFRHIHPRSAAWMMNDTQYPGRLPNYHQWIWQGRDKLRSYSWFHTPVYVSPELVASAPIHLLSTLDTQLPYILSGDIAFPSADDGMALIELSDPGKPVTTEMCDFEKAARKIWIMVRYEETHVGFLKMPTEIPIEPQETYLEEDAITARHVELYDALIDNREALLATDPDMIALKQATADLSAKREAAQQLDENATTAEAAD